MARLTFAAAALLALAVVAGLTIVGRDAGPSEAGIVPHISTDPLTDDAPVGGDVDFNFNVENVSNLGGWELDIAYDAEILVFESFTSGPFLESTGRIETCQDPSFPEPGIVRLGCTTNPEPGPLGVPRGQTPGPNGAGTLGEVEFQGLCAGESAVTFSDSSLFTVFGVSIAHSTSQGSTAMITGKPVCGEPTATPPPTSTPEPTATPVTPTSTPPPTSTPEPTSTPPPTATPATPTSTPEKPCGDADSDGEVGALDALAILQKVAGFLDDVPNADAADVNGDGEVDSLDALLILQKGAGLLEVLTC